MKLKKNLLLWNYCANLNQTVLKWTLGGPLKIEQFWPFEEIKILVMAAILDTGRHWRTQFWKGTTQGSFQQSLVEIGIVVSEEKIFF
jgi:hypothetical protein